MKIAIVAGTFFPYPGGAQVQTHNLANKLIEKKNIVDCYIYAPTNIKNNKYKIYLINYFVTSLVYFTKYYLNINLNFIIDYYIQQIIKKKKYDIWYFNFINFKSLLIINSLKRLNQKIVVTFQGVDIQKERKINYGYRFNKIYEQLLKKSLNNIDIFFSISQNIKKDLIDLKVNKKKIIDIPNCVYLKKFEKYKKYRKYKNKPELRFITVARYAKKKKGYDKISKIGKILLKKNIMFKWILVGKDINKLKDNNFIKNNNKNFILVQNIENIYEKYFPNSKLIKLYYSSDLYLNLSRIESFGITFIEALSSGLPIISFNTKGANEIVKNKYNGLIVKNFKNESYVNEITNLYKKKYYLKKIKPNASRSVKKYDLDLNSNKILKIFNRLINFKN